MVVLSGFKSLNWKVAQLLSGIMHGGLSSHTARPESRYRNLLRMVPWSYRSCIRACGFNSDLGPPVQFAHIYFRSGPQYCWTKSMIGFPSQTSLGIIAGKSLGLLRAVRAELRRTIWVKTQNAITSSSGVRGILNHRILPSASFFIPGILVNGRDQRFHLQDSYATCAVLDHLINTDFLCQHEFRVWCSLRFYHENWKNNMRCCALCSFFILQCFNLYYLIRFLLFYKIRRFPVWGCRLPK